MKFKIMEQQNVEVMGKRKGLYTFCWGKLREMVHLGNQVIDGRII
jgi:hypothetical protein